MTTPPPLPIELRTKTPRVIGGASVLVLLVATLVTAIIRSSATELLAIVTLVFVPVLIRSFFIRTEFIGNGIVAHTWLRRRYFPMNEKWSISGVPYAGVFNRYDGVKGFRYMLCLIKPSGRTIDIPSSIGTEEEVCEFADLVDAYLASHTSR